MTRSGLPRIALLALIWGSGFLWIKLADRGFSPVEVTLARLVLGAAVLSAVILVRRETVPRSLRLWVHITVAALFANAIPYLLFAVAEQTVDSSTAGIINATTPLWTVVLGFAYVLNYQIITSEGATVASTVTYLLPVVAIVLGVLVLGETITATVLAGIALVLAGVALTRRRTEPATDEPPAG